MDKETKKSIELGFNGELTQEFYEKWKYTKKKRIHHLVELLGFITLLFLFLYTYGSLFPSYIATYDTTPQPIFEIVLKILLIIFIIASLIAIYKNIMTWIDMFHVIKKRFDEYEKNRLR